MIEALALWFRRVKPRPTYEDLQTQLGCHFEEMAELVDELQVTDMNHKLLLGETADLLDRIGLLLKEKHMLVRVQNRENFLKELCDTIVTAVGVAHCSDMAITSAMEEVSRSNWSKFDENGNPLYDKNGKVKKGHRYSPPDLKGMY